jgi:ribosomal protein S18 acetylase RimI-like enzyme
VEADGEQLFNLFIACRDDLLAAFSNLDAAQRESLLRIQFEAQRNQYCRQFPEARHDLIIKDGAIIGQILVARGDGIHLVDLCLLPEHRNLGIGGNLLRDLLGEAKMAGKRVSLQVLQGNPAVRLYQRLGFNLLEEQGVYRRMEWLPGGAPRGRGNAQPPATVS